MDYNGLNSGFLTSTEWAAENAANPNLADSNGFWIAVAVFTFLFVYVIMVGVLKWHPVWVVVGIAFLPLMFVALILWARLPVWFTRLVLIGGVVDQVVRQKQENRRLPNGRWAAARN